MAIQKKELWNRKGKEMENDMEYEERTSVETMKDKVENIKTERELKWDFRNCSLLKVQVQQ